MKHASCFLLVCLLPSALPAQEAKPPLPETQIVLRISRDFIYALVGGSIQRETPVNSSPTVAGNAQVVGKIDVKLRKSEAESDFDLQFHGEVSTQMTATRRPVFVDTHGVAAFNAGRRISFDGKLFAANPLEVTVSNQLCLDAIRSFRGGVIGAVTRGIARPKVRRSLPEANRELEDLIRTKVTKAADDEADSLVTALNEIKPIVEAGAKLLIDEGVLVKEELTLYRASTEEHLLISVGLANRRIAQLPELDAAQRAPLELWIARKEGFKGMRQQFFLDNWKSLEKTMYARLAERHPDLATRFDKDFRKYLDKVEVITVGAWHVVRIAPELPKLRAEAAQR